MKFKPGLFYSIYRIKDHKKEILCDCLYKSKLAWYGEKHMSRRHHFTNESIKLAFSEINEAIKSGYTISIGELIPGIIVPNETHVLTQEIA